MANVDVGTVIGRTRIHKVRVHWDDGDETEEKEIDLKVIAENHLRRMK